MVTLKKVTKATNTARKTIFSFSKCSEKMIFQKKNCTGIWSFLYHQERWYSFSPKIWFYCLGGKWKMISVSKKDGNMMFSVCWIKIIFIFPTNLKLSFCQKSKEDLFPKNAPEDYISGITEKDNIHPWKDDIGILDWHSRKCSNDSLYFYGDLFKCFHILLSNCKNPKNLIHIGLKFDFICKLYGWRYSTMKNLWYPVPSSSQELYLEVCLSVN